VRVACLRDADRPRSPGVHGGRSPATAQRHEVLPRRRQLAQVWPVPVRGRCSCLRRRPAAPRKGARRHQPKRREVRGRYPGRRAWPQSSLRRCRRGRSRCGRARAQNVQLTQRAQRLAQTYPWGARGPRAAVQAPGHRRCRRKSFPFMALSGCRDESAEPPRAGSVTRPARIAGRRARLAARQESAPLRIRPTTLRPQSALYT
jgi:hypothetical protein